MRPPHPTDPPPRLFRGGPSRGVTLLELLLYMLLASGLTALVSQTLVSSIRSDTSMELHQRALALWSRISFLIETEVAEGNAILRNQSLDGRGTATANSLFTVMVPVEVTTAGTNEPQLRTVPIHYYMENRNLMRCGPPFNTDGSLQVGATATASDLSPALVGRRVTLALQPSTPAADAGRSVHYHLSFTSNAGQVLLPGVRSAIARTRMAPVLP